MGLISCKECNENLSDKAAACPHCGAPTPKRKSLAPWLLLILVFIVILIKPSARNSDEKKASITIEAKENIHTESLTENNIQSISRVDYWTTSISIDEMTKDRSHTAISPVTFPEKKMSFPYEDVSGQLIVQCSKRREWIYFKFSSAPNLSKDKTRDGFSVVNTRIKWNNAIETVELFQNWGASILSLSTEQDTVKKIIASQNLLLELQWHGQDKSYFSFSLNGASEAIERIMLACWKDT